MGLSYSVLVVAALDYLEDVDIVVVEVDVALDNFGDSFDVEEELLLVASLVDNFVVVVVVVD